MTPETVLVVRGIRELLERVETNQASTADYALVEELTRWWELQGQLLAAARARQARRFSCRNERSRAPRVTLAPTLRIGF